MSSTEADNIDELYKNYDILNDAKDKISEVRFFLKACVIFFFLKTIQFKQNN